MFDKQIRLYGKYADIIRKYSKDKQGADEQHFIIDNNEGTENNVYIFENILQCYMCAAMIGIINKKTMPQDSNREKTANIFVDILSKHRHNLMRIYQHMILSEDTDESIDSAVKRAFSINISNPDEAQEKINSYVRGGLLIIDEWFNNCKSYEDVANQLIDFIYEYGITE